ncbi:MAG: hypothetical protein MZU97_15710 [Bacillus subtilis]|nr:hypothetical protein [Bacillus subtilis]
MFLTYLLISVIVFVFLIGLTYVYSMYYTKQVNLRLKTTNYAKLVHPFKFFLVSIICFIVLTTLINFFPILKIEDTVVNEDNSAHYTLIRNEYYSDFYTIDIIDDYDISYNDEGMYAIAFGDDKSIYGVVNDVLESPFTLYSRIVLFDQHHTILWDTQDLYANHYELVFDNHIMDARAIEFLNDGNIVVFGLSIDLDTNVVYQTAVILDLFGNLIELIDLDISDYGFTQWGGHDNYDVVSTEHGFTVEYDTTFDGSVMVHFNEQYDYEWYVINDQGVEGGVSVGIPEEDYLETLVYRNNAYYILNDSTIKKYDDSGALIWETTYEHAITGFDVFDNEIIILSNSSEEYLVRENLFNLKDNMRRISYIHIVRINIQTGEILDIFSYQYNKIVRDIEMIAIFGHYTLKDEYGNYYILSHSVPRGSNQSNDQVYLMMKFDAGFKYLGFSTINIEGISSNDLINLLFKTSNFIEDDLLHINGVLVANRAVIDLNQLGFSEKEMNINISLYNALLTLRVYMANVTLYVLVGFIFIVLPIYYRLTKSDDDSYIDEDLLREKYGNL